MTIDEAKAIVERGEDYCNYWKARFTLAERELAGIDEILARRPALDKPTRRENIEHAIVTAKRSSDLQVNVQRLVGVAKECLDSCDCCDGIEACANCRRLDAIVREVTGG